MVGNIGLQLPEMGLGGALAVVTLAALADCYGGCQAQCSAASEGSDSRCAPVSERLMRRVEGVAATRADHLCRATQEGVG